MLANVNLAGTTLIMATHRESLLTISDNALVLKNGEQQFFGDASELTQVMSAAKEERG